MSTHLSQEQLARCLVEGPNGTSRQHLRECAVCSGDLEKLSRQISSLRLAIRDRVDHRVATHPVEAFPFDVSTPRTGSLQWRWAAVPLIVLIGMAPLLTSIDGPRLKLSEKPAETSADALMHAIDMHLSRTVPAPMEPMLPLLVIEESVSDSGGVQ